MPRKKLTLRRSITAVNLGSITAIASSAQPISKIPTNWQWGIQIVGLIATIAVTIYATRLATKALATHVE